LERLLVNPLEAIVGSGYVVTDREKMQNYLADETAKIVRPKPANDLVLVKPSNAREVSEILQFASKHRIPVFPRGGGTGLAGGSIPTQDGIILSMERMNGLEIDTANLMVVVEAGVTLETLSNKVSQAGLFFPLHPGDQNAQVGGLVATNAGGSRALRYGVMRNYVKGIEAVLPTGEILNLGGKLHKNNVGYDLLQLIIGSEGTLAVITKVILRLYAKSGATATLILPYENRHDALSSVPKILQQIGLPLAIEYVEKDVVERTARHLGEHWPAKSGNCYLIVIVAEESREQVLSQSTRLAEVCQQNRALEPLYAESKRDQDRILAIRSSIYFALKSETADILDITVPTAELDNVISLIEEIQKEANVILPIFGHAGDGNLHVHIMRDAGEDINRVEILRDRIYRIAIEAGGVITGEHGVGKIRTGKLGMCLAGKEMELMKSIKRIFDPNNVLNPRTKILV